jgi:hypothetical protein
MPKTNQIKLERIQRQAVRIATYWPIKTSTQVMYDKVKLDSIKDRASRLSNNYVTKAVQTNPLIKKYVHDYIISAPIQDGSHAKGKPRTTILSQVDLKNAKLAIEPPPVTVST